MLSLAIASPFSIELLEPPYLDIKELNLMKD